jgi:hypothetical protein
MARQGEFPAAQYKPWPATAAPIRQRQTEFFFDENNGI